MPNQMDQLNNEELEVAFDDCLESMTKTFTAEEDSYLSDMALHMESLYEIICSKYRRMKNEQGDTNGVSWKGPRDKAH